MTVRSLDCHPIGCLFAGPQAMGPAMREYLCSFDCIYSWMGAHQSDFVNSLRTHYLGDLHILPFRPPGTRVHMADYYLSSLLNEDRLAPLPNIFLQGDAQKWCDRYWQENGLAGKRVLALAPGSGSQAKNWPPFFYGNVSQWWRSTTRGETLVLRGPVEDEKMGSDPIWKEAICVREMSLGQLAVLQSRCDLYLGNDSGATHLAAAVGVSTVAIFGPTDPVQWAPRGINVSILRRGVGCSPCGLSRARICQGRICLQELVPDQVVGLLEQVVDQHSILDKEKRWS